MHIEIVTVHNQGNASQEWVQLRVKGDCDLKYYMLLDNTYKDPVHTSNKLRHVYWAWTDKSVKAGEYIFVHTGVGTYNTTVVSGIKVHHFYWGLKEPVWNNTGDTALLLQLNSWEYKAGTNK